MMTSCLEETPVFEPANPGDEVQFSLGISKSAETKTIYAGLTTSQNAFKVNWVADDQIAIYGTKCDRKSGKYIITPNSSDASKASAVTKKGVSGVQWGSEPSDFYAIYPSNDSTKFEPVTDGVKIPVAIRSQQPNIFSKTGNSWIGTPCLSNDKSKFTMVDNIMYAYTSGSNVSTRGNVPLNFKPYASVLNFKLAGWKKTSNTNIDAMQITKITLKGNQTKLAGNFTLTVNGSTPSVASTDISSTAATSIDILPGIASGSYITINANESLEFSVFMIPQEGVSIGKGWSVTLTTSHGIFEYPLDAGQNQNTTIVPGKIHVINIPAIPLTSNGTGGGDISDNAGNWITKVDPTIYLSELSLPGAWYCYDSNYQVTTDIATLYSAGVRAFHIDCRLSMTSKDEYNPGTDDDKLQLVCAGTDKFTNLGVTFTAGTTVSSKIEQIANQIKGKNEYAVVVLTVAEQPLSLNGALSGFKYYGTINPELVLKKIKQMLESNEGKWAADNRIYGYTSTTLGKSVSPYTTINDVKNHLIIKINSNAKPESFADYEDLPQTMLSFASLTSEEQYFNLHEDVEYGNFTSMMTVDNDIYWGKKRNENQISSLNDTGIDYYYIQAQKTTSGRSITDYPTSGTPSIGTRMVAINSVIDASYDQYTSSSHNKWFQMGIGGNIDGDDDYEDIAYYLNKHLKDQIEAKINEDPSPVGIVLMNYCTNPSSNKNVSGVGYTKEMYGPSLINAILRLNESFIMKRSSEANAALTLSSTKSATSDTKNSTPVLNSDGSESGWMQVK